MPQDKQAADTLLSVRFHELAWNLYNSYENFKEKSITSRRFKHSDIIPLIERLKNNSNEPQSENIFSVNEVGQSAEGRDIFLISVGTGKKKVFLWSQMHGDEPTATAALFDIFNFFSAQNEFTDFKKFLLSNLTIYFMPMVNPDGAELFQRRNIFDIDLNRDAIRQQTTEAIILKNVFDSLKADFGFNLHDQSREYTAGISINPASISFLAPAPDYPKTITPVRENAMKLIGELSLALSEFIPGHIAKYSDDFEPRAFGDNFTKWGTGVVLVETGGWRNDREKQFLRKINFITLLYSFCSIASNSYSDFSLENYNSIPNNEKLMYDLILRNLTVKKDTFEYKIDLGINYEEININDAKDFYLKGTIGDLGDLSVFSGYEDYDLEGYNVEPGLIYQNKINSIDELKNLNYTEILKQGCTNLMLNSETYPEEFSGFPVNIILNGAEQPVSEIKLEKHVDFIIKNNGEVRYAVVNGFVYDLNNPDYSNAKAIIYKK